MTTIKVKKLISAKDKAVGLLNSKKAIPVYFRTRFGIHTVLMKFPIDVVILDNKNKVVKLAENLKPYRLFLWPPIYNQVIELPAGEICKRKIIIGEVISVQNG